MKDLGPLIKGLDSQREVLVENPPADQLERPAWNAILDALEVSADGLRADCFWAPGEADLPKRQDASLFMRQYCAAGVLDYFLQDDSLASTFLRLYYGYARNQDSADPLALATYASLGAAYPPANPLLPNALGCALGAPEGLPGSVVDVVGSRFAAAHSCVAEALRFFGEHPGLQNGLPDDPDGIVLAAMICDIAAASIRPFEVVSDPDHPLGEVMFSESDLLLARAQVVEMGRSLERWAQSEGADSAGRIVGAAVDSLLRGANGVDKITVTDGPVLQRIAGELDAMVEALGAPPSTSSPEWALRSAAAIEVAWQYGRIVNTVAELRDGEHVSAEHLVPPMPDLVLLRLLGVIAAVPEDTAAGCVEGFISGMVLAADAMAGSALTEDDSEVQLALLIAASTSERRARALAADMIDGSDEILDPYLPIFCS